MLILQNFSVLQKIILIMKDKILEYIESNFLAPGDDPLTMDTPLISSGIIDSISVLQMVDFLEETFQIEFQPHEVDQDNLNTPALILSFIESKQS